MAPTQLKLGRSKLMQRSMYGIVSVAVLALATITFADEATTAPIAPKDAIATSSPATVSIEDYRALKRELEELKQRVDAQDKRLSTQPAAAPATTPPAATPPAATPPATTPPATAAPATAAPGAPWIAFPPSEEINRNVKSLFEAKTEDEYFSPFDIMNPAHIRADMPLQIGRLEDMNLYMGLQTVGRYQALQQSNVYIKGVSQPGLDPGFQDPFANLSFLGSIPDKLDVYFDTYVASRPHSSTMYGHEGYILFKRLPAPLDKGALGGLFDYINVKVGAFDIDYGDDNYRRSNNARTQRNPLIDNPLVDTNVEEIGGEVYSIKGPVYWLFGVASGTTTEHFDYGSQPSFHGKIWGYPLPEVRTSISAYHVDLSNSLDTSYLYANVRSGGALAAVFGGGDNPGQILPQAGKDVTAVQGDLMWNHWPFETYANVGWVEDSDINGPLPGTPTERWVYGAIEPVYHITPALYVAGRYSYAIASSVNGISTSGWVDRVELGGGYWITESLLGKIEYIYEQYHNFGAADGVVSGVDAFRGPRFSGVVFEVSFAF
jgi:hypothetical protein